MKVGVLGGGQLGRMLGLAGIPLGFRFRFLDPSPSAPAGAVGQLVVAAYDDEGALRRFADGLDVVTYEFENVPLRALDAIGEALPVHPSRKALATAQDRLAEKEAFRRCGIATASFAAVNSPEELEAAVAAVGYPAVLKTRRFGYDGRGQQVIRNGDDLAGAWRAIGAVPAIVEGFVAFDRELSILSARAGDGAVVHYPLVENHHREGILRLSLAPAPGVPDDVRQRAEQYARTMLQELDYVGVLAIELFLRGDELIANEMAPRVHNSGHWTIEGAVTSQFENHLRAIAGLPLGATDASGHSAMVNLIGDGIEPAEPLAFPGVHLHLYGKAARPRRKVGHITVTRDTPSAVGQTLRKLRLHGDPESRAPHGA